MKYKAFFVYPFDMLTSKEFYMLKLEDEAANIRRISVYDNYHSATSSFNHIVAQSGKCIGKTLLQLSFLIGITDRNMTRKSI